MPLSKKENKARMRVIRAGYGATQGDGGYTGVCVNCGETRVTDTHHKDGNHKNNDFNNLITLCPTCHALVTRKVITLDGLVQPKQPNPVHPVEPVVQPNVEPDEFAEIDVVLEPQSRTAKGIVVSREKGKFVGCIDEPDVRPDTLAMLDKAMKQKGTVRLYNPQVHRAGDRVLIQRGKRLVEVTIPLIDGDGNSYE